MNVELFSIGLLIGVALGLFSIAVGVGLSALAERRYRKESRR